MDFFYQAGTMGFDGKGYSWHRILDYNFPKFPIITKTITLSPKNGHPLFILPLINSVWNRVGLHNPGLTYWLSNYYDENLILSIYIDDYINMFAILNKLRYKKLLGIELNVSCPNVTPANNIYIKADICLKLLDHFKKCGNISKIFLKVRYDQNLDLFKQIDIVDRITLNSVPFFHGGASGKLAKKKNWNFIDKYRNTPYIKSIAGSSWSSLSDIRVLEDKGCTAVGIGSIMLTNPKLVERLVDYDNFR